MPASAEHVIALVSRLKDLASPGFDRMADAAEKSAERIAASERKVASEVLRTGEVRTRAQRNAERAASIGGQRAQAADDLARAQDRAAESAGNLHGQTLLAAGAVAGLVSQIADRALQATVDFAVSLRNLAGDARMLGVLSDETTLSVDALQRLNYAAKAARVETFALERGMAALAKIVEKNSPALRDLGIEAKTAAGANRTLEDVLEDVANAFASSADETGKLAVAQKLFGEQGRALIPLLNLGAQGIRELGDRASETGNAIESEMVERLARTDRALVDLQSKWDGFVLRVKVAIVDAGVRVFDPASLVNTQAQRDAVQWIKDQQAAAQEIVGTGLGTALADARILEIRKRASEIAAERGRAAKAAEDDAIAAAAATAREREEVEKLDKAVESLTKRLATSDLGRARTDELAEGFNAGRESVRSLLVALEGNAGAVEKIVERARLMRALVEEYGDSWKAADLFTRSHTDGVKGTEDKLRKVHEIMQGIVAEGEKYGETLRKVREDKIKPQEIVPSRVPEFVPPQVPQDQGAPAELFEFFARTGDENSPDRVFLRSVQSMTAAFSQGVGDWGRELVAFKGIFGQVVEAMVTTWLEAMARMFAVSFLTRILGLGGAPIPGIPGAPGFIDSPIGGGGPVGITRAGRGPLGEAGSAPAVVQNVYVNALDFGTYRDRERSPFGMIRQAAEEAFESQVYG